MSDKSTLIALIDEARLSLKGARLLVLDVVGGDFPVGSPQEEAATAIDEAAVLADRLHAATYEFLRTA